MHRKFARRWHRPRLAVGFTLLLFAALAMAGCVQDDAPQTTADGQPPGDASDPDTGAAGDGASVAEPSTTEAHQRTYQPGVTTEWRMAHGGPGQRRALGDESVPVFRTAWSQALAQDVAHVAADRHHVFVATGVPGDDARWTRAAYDQATGARAWAHEEHGFAPTAWVASGQALFAANATHVASFGTDAGGAVWATEFPPASTTVQDATTASVDADGRLVQLAASESLVLAAGRQLHAFHAANGSLAWTARTADGTSAQLRTMGPLDAMMVVGERMDGQLSAWATGDGALLWTRSIEPPASTPLLANGTLLLHGANGTFTALDPGSGDVRWHRSAPGLDARVHLMSAATLLVEDASGRIRAYGTTDGTLRWSFATPYDGPVSLSMVPDAVYWIGAEEVFEVDPATGAQRASWGLRTAPASEPLLVFGRLILVTADAGGGTMPAGQRLVAIGAP